LSGKALVAEFARRFSPGAIFERAGVAKLLRELSNCTNSVPSSAATGGVVSALFDSELRLLNGVSGLPISTPLIRAPH